jgi:hypothetical protein
MTDGVQGVTVGADTESMSPSELQLLCWSVGDRLRELHRLHFLYQGELDTSEGDLILVFESGRIVRLSHTPAGYDLSVTSGRLVGPPVEALGEEDQQTAEEYGKFVEVCLNGQPEWQPFIGARLTAVGRLIYIDHNEPCGVSLHFKPNRAIFVYDLSDEVLVGQSINRTWFREQPVCCEKNPMRAPALPPSGLLLTQ